ncbi:LOW QUALITY PROTEIN: WD repeat-containing protein 46 [Zonotrichia albicollis]|uniref:LOW QUALITY PROTEIN: WD repeat-containing protein 46 n=1 Tax=Zonotrichia albicollis TaxID=44394 RepID=UPI003D812319
MGGKNREFHFELRLEQFGPYRLDYTRDGRFLLLGGLRGHVAALDWAQRRLLSEFSVMETVRDVSWLHCESLLAVAQRRWLHVYDSQGLEIHVVRSFQNLLQLQFLPYHFLLAATSSLGLLHFLDVSVGREVATLSTRSGRAAAMAQDPATALIHLGHANGTVSLWSPNAAEPAARVLAHRGSVRAIAVHGSTRLMATAGLDRKIRIFDLRTFGALQEWGLPIGAAQLDFSQRGAPGCGLRGPAADLPQTGLGVPPFGSVPAAPNPNPGAGAAVLPLPGRAGGRTRIGVQQRPGARGRGAEFGRAGAEPAPQPPPAPGVGGEGAAGKDPGGAADPGPGAALARGHGRAGAETPREGAAPGF